MVWRFVWALGFVCVAGVWSWVSGASWGRVLPFFAPLILKRWTAELHLWYEKQIRVFLEVIQIQSNFSEIILWYVEGSLLD